MIITINIVIVIFFVFIFIIILMIREPFQFRIVDQPPPLGLIKTEVDPRVMEVLGIQ